MASKLNNNKQNKKWAKFVVGDDFEAYGSHDQAEMKATPEIVRDESVEFWGVSGCETVVENTENQEQVLTSVIAMDESSEVWNQLKDEQNDMVTNGNEPNQKK